MKPSFALQEHREAIGRIDRFGQTAAKVREKCGIPGTSVKTTWLCRDKPSMKDALREAGVLDALGGSALMVAMVTASRRLRPASRIRLETPASMRKALPARRLPSRKVTLPSG